MTWRIKNIHYSFFFCIENNAKKIQQQATRLVKHVIHIHCLLSSSSICNFAKLASIERTLKDRKFCECLHSKLQCPQYVQMQSLQRGRPKCACWENLKNLSFYSAQKNEQWLKRSFNSLALNYVYWRFEYSQQFTQHDS